MGKVAVGDGVVLQALIFLWTEEKCTRSTKANVRLETCRLKPNNVFFKETRPEAVWQVQLAVWKHFKILIVLLAVSIFI